ncbi:hypothetical protein [Janibacter anophelis]|uniref:hypothetical protein n=1 Tax=Janibacter anophelis TaxID=319054 RepID=UPI00082FC1CF|nr:hypothetical protein [Janibacter anophelis]
MVTDTTLKGPEPLRVVRGLVLLLAALLLVAAVYYYFVPVHVASKEGVFGCGSASNPPSADKDGFQFGACQKSAVVNQFRTYALLAGAVLTALAGFLLFRTPRPDDWDEDVDLSDRDVTRRGDRRADRADRVSRGARAERADDSRELRGVRREDTSRRGAVDEAPRETRRDSVDEAPRETRRDSVDDWDDAVADEPVSRSSRRGDDFLDDEIQDAPRRSRRRRDDDF